MRTSGLLLMRIVLTTPLLGQDLPVRPIPEPVAPPLPLITITDADRASLIFSLLEHGYPHLVKAAGTTQLRLFLEALPPGFGAHDSLKALARRYPSLRLCGPGFSRCAGPYPSLHVVRVEPQTPGQVAITLYYDEGINPILWRRLLDPAVQWKREMELGYFPVAFDRQAEWRHFPPGYMHSLGWLYGLRPSLLATRARNGWFITARE